MTYDNGKYIDQTNVLAWIWVTRDIYYSNSTISIRDRFLICDRNKGLGILEQRKPDLYKTIHIVSTNSTGAVAFKTLSGKSVVLSYETLSYPI